MPNEADGIALNRHPGLYLRLDTPKGRGVFTTTSIAAGSVVDVCPVLMLSRADAATMAQTILDSYTYNWPAPEDVEDAEGTLLNPRQTIRNTQAVVLGLGSMFNHSVKDQNVGWSRSIAGQIITYTALREIQPGEELCINYGKVWFKDTDGTSDSEHEDADQMLGRIEADQL